MLGRGKKAPRRKNSIELAAIAAAKEIQLQRARSASVDLTAQAVAMRKLADELTEKEMKAAAEAQQEGGSAGGGGGEPKTAKSRWKKLRLMHGAAGAFKSAAKKARADAGKAEKKAVAAQEKAKVIERARKMKDQEDTPAIPIMMRGSALFIQLCLSPSKRV